MIDVYVEIMMKSKPDAVWIFEKYKDWYHPDIAEALEGMLSFFS